jgi:two-component system sensor histidine kinase/response regulator
MKEISEKAGSILIVDDTAENIDILREALKQEYAIKAATSGSKALEIARSAPVDLILLDVMMPEMDGYEVCRALKAEDATRDIPVIFVTSMLEVADEMKGFAAGAVDYISKPISVPIVQVRVAAHLQIQRQKQRLRESYDRLRKLEELRDNLVHMIVHDMRTPLTAVLGFLQLTELIGGEGLPRKLRDYLKSAGESVKDLVEMVSSVLDVSKMEAGEMNLTMADCDLMSIARDALTKVESLKRGRELTLKGPEEPVTVIADAAIIPRVLQNLLDNALKFTPDGARIQVEIRHEEGKVHVSVQDTGPGISHEDQEKVFDKFWNAEARKQGDSHSTGLGLTFCKMAVEAHGGRIGVDSEGGRGSTFWFELATNRHQPPEG